MASKEAIFYIHFGSFSCIVEPTLLSRLLVDAEPGIPPRLFYVVFIDLHIVEGECTNLKV